MAGARLGLLDRITARTTDRRFAVMLGLGFASGLPWPLSGFTLRQWMSEGHVSLVLIGLTGSLGLSYSLKVFWAPALDRPPPLLGRFGRRRGWLLLAQPALMAAMAALAFADPRRGVGYLLAVGAVIAFLSATQDIAIDAWRIESFAPAEQGPALGLYVWGYRLALLAGGAGAIALASPLGWRRALLVVAAAGLVGLAATLLAREPRTGVLLPRVRGVGAALRQAYAGPLAEFFARPGAVAVAVYVVLFKMGEATAAVMVVPYYRALGFDRAAVALANGPVSLAATIAGYALGGVVVARLGLGRALVATGFGQMASMAMYLALGAAAGSHAVLVGTSVVEAFVEGLADAAFLTFLSALCAPAFTATQYALLSSLATVPLRTLGGAAGWLAREIGWAPFFTVAMAASLPAMLVMLGILAKWPGVARGAPRG